MYNVTEKRSKAYATRFKNRYPIGSKYGGLTIVDHRSYSNPYKKSTSWGAVCRCDCGTVKFMKSPSALKRGTVKSCGCFDRIGAARKGVKAAARRNVRTKYPKGTRYGRLTVVGYKSYIHSHLKARSWGIMCRCDCGKLSFSKYPNQVKNGAVVSCGCAAAEASARNIKAATSARTRPPGEAARNFVFTQYKRNSKIRGIKFALTRDQVYGLISKECFYCGSPPSGVLRYYSGGNFYYNGIDRSDNAKGYTEDNCVACCSFCNMAKREKSAVQFEDWLDSIVRHRTASKIMELIPGRKTYRAQSRTSLRP